MANLLSSTTVGGNAVITTDNIGTYAITSLSGYATQSYVNTQVSNLVDSAPGALNTLNELAAALGDDANFSTTVTNSIATKVPLSGSATITGFKTFATVVSSQDDWQNSPISILERDNIGTGSTSNTYAPNLNFHWRSRTSQSLWMNSAGDLHYGSYGSTGVPAVDGTFKAGTLYAGSGQITSTKVSNWDTAYGWGNHASAGYASSSHTHGEIDLDMHLSRQTVNIDSYNPDAFWGTSIATSTSHGTKPAFFVNIYNLAGNGSSDQTQLATYYGSSNNFWMRSRSDNGNVWLGWTQVWTSDVFANNSANWNTAYSWGNHASAGYLTSLPSHTHSASDITSGVLSTDRLPK